MKIKTLLLAALVPLMCNAADVTTVKLWENGAPNSNGLTQRTEENHRYVYGVTDSELQVYLPDKPITEKLVLICPGGGYKFVSMLYEGNKVAEWFRDQGIPSAVFLYRLPNNNKEILTSDVERAFDIIRENADKWKISPDSVGLMGFSAGGHLASYYSNVYKPGNRPAFSILIYPVTTFDEDIAHSDTRWNFLSDVNSKQEEAACSPLNLVTTDTPPTFIAVGRNDRLYPDSELYREALDAKKVPHLFLVFPPGGHGWGIKESFPYRDAWLSSLRSWLMQLKPAKK